MKKLMAILLAVTLILTAAPMLALASTANYTDFSEAAPEGWTLNNSATASIKDGVLEIKNGQGELSSVWKLAKPYPTGTVVVEYDFKSSSDKASFYIQSPKGGSVCRLQQVGNVVQLQHSKDDASANENTIITKEFNIGEWYHVKHVISYRDNATDAVNRTTSSVYLYNSSGAEIGRAEDKVYMDASKNASPTELQVFQIINMGTKECTMYIDNIAVYENTEAAIIEMNKLASRIDASKPISKSLDLNTRGYGGAVIEWESSNPSVIDNTGKLTKPEGQCNVNLTLNITYNDTTESITYSLTVVPGEGDIIEADVYAYSFDDNIAPAGFKLSTTGGYAGIRNGRIELDRPSGATVTKSPQTTISFTKMPFGSFSGKFALEFDFITTADTGAKFYIQASPNTGSLVRLETISENEIKLTTGGNGDTSVSTSVKRAYVQGEKNNAKFILDMVNKKCSAYLNGELLCDNDNFLSAASPSELNTMVILNDGTMGNVITDNFVLYHDDAESSLITTAEMLILGDLSNVMDSIPLPTQGYNGTQIEWTSSDESILSNSGELLVNLSTDSNVTLTALLKNSEYKIAKCYEVCVKGVQEPQALKVSAPSIFDNVKNSASATCINGLVDVTYNVEKPSGSELELCLLALEYNNDGALVRTYLVSDSLSASRTYGKISLYIPKTSDDCARVSVMLWKGMGKMLPLTTASNYVIGE